MNTRKQILTGVTCAGILLLATTPVFAAQPSRPIGDSKFIASVGAPGYPEGIVVSKGKIYVSGPAAFGIAVQSTIHVYDLDSGAFLHDIPIQGQPANGNRALSCIAADDDGDLYVLVEFVGVVKIDRHNGQQSVYASGFVAPYQSPFSPGAPDLLNDLAFDKKGNLYVTDSLHATIFRVPPGGGTAQVWYSGASIDGPFGPNGVRIDEKSKKMYFTVTFTPTGTGAVYTLPLVDNPTPADLQVFHGYTPGAGPDGVVFGKSGKLYVALAGYNQISVLREDGTEEARFSGPAGTLPWAAPANMAFNDKDETLLVTNHASLGPYDPSLFAIFDVFVNDRAGKMFGAKH